MPKVAPTFQVDTDTMENLLPVVDTHWQNEFVERTGYMMEMHWGTSQPGNGLNGDSEGGDNDNKDKDNKKNEDNKDEDKGEDNLLFSTLKYQVFSLGTSLVRPSSVKLQL